MNNVDKPEKLDFLFYSNSCHKLTLNKIEKKDQSYKITTGKQELTEHQSRGRACIKKSNTDTSRCGGDTAQSPEHEDRYKTLKLRKS